MGSMLRVLLYSTLTEGMVKQGFSKFIVNRQGVLVQLMFVFS